MGKDSVAMGLMLEERHPEINFIWLFCDSGIEFPEVYEILEKLKERGSNGSQETEVPLGLKK